MRPTRFLPLTFTLTLMPIASCVNVDSPTETRQFAAPAEDGPPATSSPAAAPTPSPQEPAAAPTKAPAKTLHAQRGPLEFTLGGVGVSNDSVNAGSGQAAGSVGYYLSDTVEVLLRQNASFYDAGKGESESWTGASRLAIDLHLPLGNVVPYVGANLGWVYGNGIHDSFLGGPEAGVKFYVKDDVFVLVGAEYQFFFESSDSLDDAFDNGQIVYGLSFGVRF